MAFSQQGRVGGLYRPLAEINVTPLVDVMLVLLVIFMVTAPMLASGLKVDLPQAKQAQPLNPKDPVVITLAKDGRLSLGSEEIAKDGLIAAVQAKLEGDNNRTIHLRGDKQVVFGDIVAIMDLLASNGLTHIAIIADARAKADAPQDGQAPAAPQDGQTAAAPPQNAQGATAPAAASDPSGGQAAPR